MKNWSLDKRGRNCGGKGRRRSGSITKWSTIKWKTSLKSISFHSSAAVSIFYLLGNWKATLIKSRNSWFMWMFDGKMWWWWLLFCFSEKWIFRLNPWQKKGLNSCWRGWKMIFWGGLKFVNDILAVDGIYNLPLQLFNIVSYFQQTWQLSQQLMQRALKLVQC